ncbi:hypothetical protein DH86_00003748, partial [Scytalidium sp. 3C]
PLSQPRYAEGTQKHTWARASKSRRVKQSKRRQQLRDAQQSYRRRKETEISELKSRMKNMQLDAVRLSESLVDLLDDVIKDSDSLKPSLYASLVSAVKHMIPIANAIVEVAPSEIGTSPSSEDSGKSSTMDQNSQ